MIVLPTLYGFIYVSGLLSTLYNQPFFCHPILDPVRIVHESKGIKPVEFAEHPGLLSQATFHHLKMTVFFKQIWGYPKMVS